MNSDFFHATDLPKEKEASVESSSHPALPHLIAALISYPKDSPPEGYLGGPGFGANYVISGKGLYQDHLGREYQLLPGSLYFRCGKYPHHTHWTQEEAVQEYFISMSRFTYEHLESLGLVVAHNPPVLQLGPRKWVVDRFESFIDRFAGSDGQEIGSLLREVVAFLAEVREHCLQSAPKHLHVELVERAKNLIEARPAERSDIRALAPELGVSYSLLRKAFQEIVGQSLSEYRVRSRLQLARIRLDSHSVQAVADELGYGDVAAFSKQFKQFVGISPKKFQLLYYRS